MGLIALIAQAFGLTLDERLLICRVQFPAMRHYDRDTWYDIHRRIDVANSKGLVGVGLSRKGIRSSQATVATRPDSKNVRGNHGWEVVRDLRDVTVIERNVTDDNLPNGTHQKVRRYVDVAPLAMANREDDYRTSWSFFEQLARKPMDVAARNGRGP